MFRGRKQLSLDAKGRLTMPAKYRDRLQESCDGELVITIDRSKCLLIYPLPEWEEVEAKLAKLSSTRPEVRRFTRFITHNAEEVEMDKQGRFVIPPHLREYANLDRQVVLAGHVNKLELWDQGSYDAEALDWPDEMEMPDEVANLSF